MLGDGATFGTAIVDVEGLSMRWQKLCVIVIPMPSVGRRMCPLGCDYELLKG